MHREQLAVAEDPPARAEMPVAQVRARLDLQRPGPPPGEQHHAHDVGDTGRSGGPAAVAEMGDERQELVQEVAAGFGQHHEVRRLPLDQPGELTGVGAAGEHVRTQNRERLPRRRRHRPGRVSDEPLPRPRRPRPRPARPLRAGWAATPRAPPPRPPPRPPPAGATPRPRASATARRARERRAGAPQRQPRRVPRARPDASHERTTSARPYGPPIRPSARAPPIGGGGELGSGTIEISGRRAAAAAGPRDGAGRRRRAARRTRGSGGCRARPSTPR